MVQMVKLSKNKNHLAAVQLAWVQIVKKTLMVVVIIAVLHIQNIPTLVLLVAVVPTTTLMML